MHYDTPSSFIEGNRLYKRGYFQTGTGRSHFTFTPMENPPSPLTMDTPLTAIPKRGSQPRLIYDLSLSGLNKEVTQFAHK